MSKPRYRWWGYARKMVKDYPKLMNNEHLSPDDERDRAAVSEAIRITIQQPGGPERLAFIERVYFGRCEQLLQAAAIQSNISGATAARWHGDFIRLVGKCRGFDINQPPRKRGPRSKKLEPPAQMEAEGES